MKNKRFSKRYVFSIIFMAILCVFGLFTQTKGTRAASEELKLDGVWAWNIYIREKAPKGKYSIKFKLPAFEDSPEYDGFSVSGNNTVSYVDGESEVDMIFKCDKDNYYYSRDITPFSTGDISGLGGMYNACVQSTNRLPLYGYMDFGSGATLTVQKKSFCLFFCDDGDKDEFYDWFTEWAVKINPQCYELNGDRNWEYSFSRPGSELADSKYQSSDFICNSGNSSSSPTKYKVTYDKNGGDTISKNFEYITKNTQVDLPSATWEEHTLTGWNTAADGTGTSYNTDSKYTVTGTAKLYAQWKINQYKVTYNPNGGSVTTKEVTVDSGKTTELPKPTRTGYTFTGWYTAATGGESVGIDKDSYTVTEDVTLYAHWLLNEVPKFEVTYNPNGGSVTPEKEIVESGKTTELPEPKRTGYTFTGWYTAATGGTLVGKKGELYTVTGKVTLYAHWDINKYTVTYDATGGSVTPENVPVEYGNTTELPEPKRTGYTFIGWYTAATDGEFKGMSGVSYKVTETVTLYAHWAEIAKETYLIRYNANGGDSAPYATAYSDTGYITSEYPRRFGYLFIGWSDDPEKCNKPKYTKNDTFTKSNITLYACWEAVDNTNRCSLRSNPATSDKELIVLAVLSISTLFWLYSYFIMKKVKQ